MAAIKSFRDLMVYQRARAEAWARRRYEAAFINKVNEALGEAMETQAWLDHALDSGYISTPAFSRSDAAWQEIGGMLHRMIEKADTFCRKTLE